MVQAVAEADRFIAGAGCRVFTGVFGGGRRQHGFGFLHKRSVVEVTVTDQ